MATHSSILAWKIPWTEKPGGLQSKPVTHRPDWAHTHIHTCIHWRFYQTILEVCTCYEKLKMRKTVYLPKYFPHLLLFLHSQSFKFPSGVIVLSTKCSHVKRSSEKNAESKGKQWASLSCCWDHTSSGQRRAPLPEALGTCLAVAATAALRLPGGRGGRGEKQQTGQIGRASCRERV